jgi:AcrR family transcriptional regulator
MSTTPICGSGIPASDSSLDPRVARSRRRLLDAATDLLVEAGPRGVTVDAVSERSGVAKSTLYRHWDSREALLVDVMRANVPQIAEPDLSLPFEAALRSVVHELATTLADPEWARILPALIQLKQQIPELQQLSEGDTEEKLHVLQRVLRSGIDAGALPADIDVHLVAHVLIGPMLFAALSGSGDDIMAIGDYCVDRLLASYRP